MAIIIRTARNVRIDAKLYATHIALYCQVMRKAMAELVKQEARLLARDAADMYPPFSGSAPQITSGGQGGFGNKARDKGRAAVNRDVRKIFAPLDQAPGGVIAAKGDPAIFYDWVQAKMDKPKPSLPTWLIEEHDNTGGLFAIDVYQRFIASRKGNFGGDGNVMLHESEGQIASIHRLIRGSDNYRVGKNRQPDFFIKDWKIVEKYIKRVQQRVGKLKAGWYWAGSKLGSMPTSAWVRDQGSGDAILKTQLTGPNPKIRIGNAIGKNGNSWHIFQKAWNHRGFAMREKMLHALKGKKNHGKLLDVVSKLKGGFELSDK